MDNKKLEKYDTIQAKKYLEYKANIAQLKRETFRQDITNKRKDEIDSELSILLHQYNTFVELNQNKLIVIKVREY